MWRREPELINTRALPFIFSFCWRVSITFDSGECIQPSFIHEEKHKLNRGSIFCSLDSSAYDEWLSFDECASNGCSGKGISHFLQEVRQESSCQKMSKRDSPSFFLYATTYTGLCLAVCYKAIERDIAHFPDLRRYLDSSTLLSKYTSLHKFPAQVFTALKTQHN